MVLAMRNSRSRSLLLGTAFLATQTLTGCNSPVDVRDRDSLQAPVDTQTPSEFLGPVTNGLHAPVRIKAGGEFIAVDSPGYACPTMADVDGDGLKDLIVGQFSGGNMQFCKNIAKQGLPDFAEPEWLMTGNERAIVPGVW